MLPVAGFLRAGRRFGAPAKGPGRGRKTCFRRQALPRAGRRFGAPAVAPGRRGKTCSRRQALLRAARRFGAPAVAPGRRGKTCSRQHALLRAARRFGAPAVAPGRRGKTQRPPASSPARRRAPRRAGGCSRPSGKTARRQQRLPRAVGPGRLRMHPNVVGSSPPICGPSSAAGEAHLPSEVPPAPAGRCSRPPAEAFCRWDQSFRRRRGRSFWRRAGASRRRACS